jgi:hypothetical protein
MSFFSRFPLLAYDIKNTENYKVLPDILRRVKLRTSIKGSTLLFDTYDVKDGERPEDVAFKWFGDAELHWVILMTNNVLDRYYDWPMSQQQLEVFLKDKYSNPDAIHHYETPRTSGRTTGQGPFDYSYLVEVNSDTDNASSISNREFEERKQDQKRSIRLLDKRYLPDFIDEFNNLVNG